MITKTASEKFFCATHGTANVVEDYGTHQSIYCEECRSAQIFAMAAYEGKQEMEAREARQAAERAAEQAEQLMSAEMVAELLERAAQRIRDWH